MAPGKCMTCGQSHPQTWVWDTQAENPGEVKFFRVYLCSECVLAAAKELEPYTGVKLVSVDALAVMVGTTAAADEWQQRAERAEGKLAELAAFVQEGAV